MFAILIVNYQSHHFRHDQPKMFGNASDKIRMHQDRYNLVIQRILRNPLWNQTSVNRGYIYSKDSLEFFLFSYFLIFVSLSWNKKKLTVEN